MVSKVSQSPPKRSMTKAEIQKVLSYRGKSNIERLAISLFTFSYYSAGINFIDMAMLKHSNITMGSYVT